MAAQLSKADVAALLQDRSAGSRATTAQKIATEYESAALSARERHLAEEIFRVMVRDVELRVRETLAGQLKHCPVLPHDIARAFADDVESVSLPVIRYSTVLTDEDLIEIVRGNGSAKQKAVASRDSVSLRVADALVDTNDEEVISTLVANPGAEISESSLQKALDTFGEREKVNGPMALRTKLPIRVAERLVNLVSDRLREHLLTHQEISGTLASDIILQSRERATLGLIAPESDRRDVEALVAELHASKRLTSSIILRALFMGDIVFFEIALAELAGIPASNASMLIRDEGGLGLRALVKKAGISEALYPALRSAIEVCQDTAYDGAEGDRERYRRRVIERVLTRFSGAREETAIGQETLEYLLTKLRGIGGEGIQAN